MDPLGLPAVIAVIVAGVGGAAAGFYYLTRGPRSAWQLLGEDLGIAATGPGLLEGFWHGWPVTVRELPQDRGIVLELRGLPRALHFAHRDILADHDVDVGALKPMTIGDAAFDDEILVRGSEARALATFEVDVRAVLLEICRPPNHAAFADGVLSFEVKPPQPVEAAWLEVRLEEMEVLGEALRVSNVPWTLLHNLQDEPIAAVRARILTAVVPYATNTGDHELRQEIVSSVRRGLDDPDPLVRFTAARLVGPEGRKHLRNLLGDPLIPGPVRAKAFEALVDGGVYGDGVVGDALDEAVEQALIDPDLDLLATLIDMATTRGLQAILPHLIEKAGPHVPVLTEADTEVADTGARLARALGRSGVSDSEDLLFTLLDWPTPKVRLAAARALGKVGTGRAVARLWALREVEQLGRVATESLSAIQARHGGDAGGLSLVPEEAETGGELSEAEVDGSLSVSDEPATEE